MQFQSDNTLAKRVYEFAAEVIRNTNNGKVGFKYAFSKTKIDNKLIRPVYAIGAKALKNWNTCDEILEESGILKEHPDIDQSLLRVLVVDLLWGNKKLKGNSNAVLAVLKKKEQLKNFVRNEDNEVTSSKIDPSMHVFHVRVNTFKSTLKSCLEHLQKLGFSKMKTPGTYEEYLSAVNNLGLVEFMSDFHFNDLLVIRIKAKPIIVADSLFQDKLITIQSKSSLIPVKLMNVEPGNVVLDMCAAPGMKTAAIVSQLQGEGLVYAVDRDCHRFKEMVKILEELGVHNNIECINKDALLFKSEDIDLILLDVPCSGSGMTTRLGETGEDKLRLRKLQWIQMKLLNYALTAFPSVKRIVYSTCSMYSEENEAVIDEVIKSNKDSLNYKLIDCHKMISGFAQGSDMYEYGPLCLKVLSTKDFANGFFVAVFDKISIKMEKKSKINSDTEDQKDDDQNKGIIYESEDNIAEQDVDSEDTKPKKVKLLKRKKKSNATFPDKRPFKKTKWIVESFLNDPKTATTNSDENVVEKSSLVAKKKIKKEPKQNQKKKKTMKEIKKEKV